MLPHVSNFPFGFKNYISVHENGKFDDNLKVPWNIVSLNLESLGGYKVKCTSLRLPLMTCNFPTSGCSLRKSYAFLISLMVIYWHLDDYI